MQTRAKFKKIKIKIEGASHVQMIIMRQNVPICNIGRGLYRMEWFYKRHVTQQQQHQKKREISKLIHLRDESLYGARELPIFYLDGKIMARHQSIVWGVCAYGGLFPHPAIHIRPICQTAYAIRLKLAGDPEWMNGLGQKIYKKIHVRMCWTIRWTTESKKATK